MSAAGVVLTSDVDVPASIRDVIQAYGREVVDAARQARERGAREVGIVVVVNRRDDLSGKATLVGGARARVIELCARHEFLDPDLVALAREMRALERGEVLVVVCRPSGSGVVVVRDGYLAPGGEA